MTKSCHQEEYTEEFMGFMGLHSLCFDVWMNPGKMLILLTYIFKSPDKVSLPLHFIQRSNPLV